jgi:myo-inositol-1(or 4)-monophosphatase
MDSKYFDTALKAAKKAGEIQREHLSLPKEVFFKGAIDLVTDVDRACEKVIIKVIRHDFPEHGVLSEESPAQLSESPFLWIIDPLDGTTNYTHGYPCFCVSIALQKDGETILGVVFEPEAGNLYHAVRGEGAFKNNSPLEVSKTGQVAHALLCTGFPYDVGSSKRNNLREFNTMIKTAQGIRRDGSAALDLCRVAEGSFDGFWEIKLNPWDVAAGAFIVEEAGGAVTSLSGTPFDPFADSIACSNGRIHKEMLDILRSEV